MEPDNFDDVRAALAKATPGEWEQGVAGRAGVVVFDGDDVRPVAATTPANADFIALAHNRMPAVLAALDAANARLAEAEKLLRTGDRVHVEGTTTHGSMLPALTKETPRE